MAEECEDKPKETMKASPVDANKNAPGNSCAHPVLVGRSSGVAAVVVAVSCFKQIAGLRKNTEQRLSNRAGGYFFVFPNRKTLDATPSKDHD